MYWNILRVLLVRWRHFTTHLFSRCSLADYQSKTGIDYIRSLRPICEVIFYFLLLVYRAGVRAYVLHSQADKFATSAISHAMNAAIMATTLGSAADEEAGDALKFLQQRFAFWCFYFRSQNLLIETGHPRIS